MTHETKTASIKMPGTVYHIGKRDMILLDEFDGKCLMLAKDMYRREVLFGDVKKVCREFAAEIESDVGYENIIKCDVDITSSGSYEYEICQKAALLDTDSFRKYQGIIKKYNIHDWWWLATPWEDDDTCITCVSPDEDLSCLFRVLDYAGVRPYCVLKSSVLNS